MVNIRSFKLLVSITAMVISFVGCTTTGTSELNASTPKNIILFIGDGMGVTHLTAGKVIKGNLEIERCDVGGILTTYCATTLYTDSAAAGTALATGVKTYKGAISMSVEKKPLKTTLEHAEEAAKATGLVATCSLTHATPASFAAHVPNREMHSEIAMDIVNSGVDVLFGGGLMYFLPKSIEGGAREDGVNLISKLQERMPLIKTEDEFLNLGDVNAVAGFFAPKHPGKPETRRPSLAKLTAKAIEILAKDENGFFLMVEGSQIDWASHDNDAETLIEEVIDFDAAIGKGMDFAESNSETLIVVTADHETGGFVIHSGSMKDNRIDKMSFATKSHSCAMVPIFAYGPGSSVFGGFKDNTQVGKMLIQYLGGNQAE